ncbi:hypothetical protein INR49_011928, partial [Caranx melampygus]
MIIATGTNSSSDALSRPSAAPAQISAMGLDRLDPKQAFTTTHHHHAKGQKIRRVAFLGQVTLTTCPKVNWMAIAQRCLYSMSSGARTHGRCQQLLYCGLLSGGSLHLIRFRAGLMRLCWKRSGRPCFPLYLGIAGGKSELNWESDYLQGIKRVRRLYCNVGIGFTLQVLPDGRISGAHNENKHSELHPGKLLLLLLLLLLDPEKESNPMLQAVSDRDLHRGPRSHQLFGVRSELCRNEQQRRLYGT